jgi:hypothetical protein
VRAMCSAIALSLPLLQLIHERSDTAPGCQTVGR